VSPLDDIFAVVSFFFLPSCSIKESKRETMRESIKKFNIPLLNAMRCSSKVVYVAVRKACSLFLGVVHGARFFVSFFFRIIILFR